MKSNYETPTALFTLIVMTLFNGYECPNKVPLRVHFITNTKHSKNDSNYCHLSHSVLRQLEEGATLVS